MTATLVQTKTGSTAANSTALALALTSNTNAGDTIIIAITQDDTTDDISSVSAVGMSFSKITSASGLTGDGFTYLSVWYAYNISAGTTPTVTVNKSTSVSLEAVLFHVSGLTTTNPLDQVASASGSSASPSSGNTGTLTQANEFIIGVCGSDFGGATYTVGSGYSNLTQIAPATDFSEMAMQSKVVVSTTPVASAMTISNATTWRASVMSFLISSSSGPFGTATGIATVSGVSQIPATVAGLLFPAYIAPPDAAYSTLISLMGTYPSVRVVVILNPSNGPGTSVDSAYTTVISQLQTAGAKVIGYVHTSYGARAIATVEADVATWKSFYPTINGIFIDEMDNTSANVSYYVSLNSYIHGLGLGLTIGNPGQNTIAAYFSNPTADVICVVEETDGSWPNATVASNGGLGTFAQRAGIVTNVAYNATDFRVLDSNCSLVWATDQSDTYDNIPTYLSTEMAALSGGATGSAIGSATVTGISASRFMASGNAAGSAIVTGISLSQNPDTVGDNNPQAIQQFDFSVDILKSILWQYDKAANLIGLLKAKQSWYDTNQTEFWQDWYSNVFNLETADQFGLAVWSIILGLPIFVNNQNSGGPFFGFDNQTGYNFDNGIFGDNDTYQLPVETQRIALQLRYFQLTSAGTVPEVNRMLKYVFRNYGTAYLIDYHNMTQQYVFNFELTFDLQYLFNNYDILPRPAGVQSNYTDATLLYFGFARGDYNFDNGIFGQ